MEIKESFMLSGSALVQHEVDVAASDPDVEMLESVDSLKMVAEFEGAIAALENAIWSPEAIGWTTTTPVVARDGA
jgi:hypothetical protein